MKAYPLVSILLSLFYIYTLQKKSCDSVFNMIFLNYYQSYFQTFKCYLNVKQILIF